MTQTPTKLEIQNTQQQGNPMKNLARVTLIISHDELTRSATNSHFPETTADLVGDLIHGDAASYEYGVDVIDMTVTPLALGIDKDGDDEDGDDIEADLDAMLRDRIAAGVAAILEDVKTIGMFRS